MKILYILVFCPLNFKGMPRSFSQCFLKVPIKAVEKSLLASGLGTGTDILNSGKLYWFPTIKYMDVFGTDKVPDVLLNMQTLKNNV
jgi:hypothetical protein